MKRNSAIYLGLLCSSFAVQSLAQQPACNDNVYTSEVVSKKQISATCTWYEVKVTFDGAGTDSLSNYSVDIPCGRIRGVRNSKKWKQSIGKNPMTGGNGFRIRNTGAFDASGGKKSFMVYFTWCSNNSCEKKSAVASYKYGRCLTNSPLEKQSLLAAKDSTNCSSLLATLQKSNVKCATGTDGTIEVVIQEGTAPIKYSWSNGATTAKAENLAPGSYSVTITDAKNNTLTLTESISSLPPITISETISNPFCSGAATGSIELAVTGGSGAFTYLWSNGSTNQNLSNLSSGIYSVTVADSLGCTAKKSYMLSNSTLLSASVTLKHPSCTQVNGGIDITPSGGLAPYTFLWNNGATTEDIQNVGVGNYSVTIKDAAGCSSEKRYTLRLNSTLFLNSIINPVSCLGDNSGAIDLSILGGVPPFSISWADGPTTEDRSNLSAGQYLVTVKDAAGCSISANYTIFRKALQVTSDLFQPACSNDLGSIKLTVAGVPPYTYAWSNGDTDAEATGLPAGFYSVKVSDGTGCQRQLDFAILAPPAITVTHVLSNPLCDDENSYAVDLTLAGGKPPFKFLWSNGATTEDLTGLRPGTYSVAITDNGGCTVNREYVIDPVTAGWTCLINQPSAGIVCGSAGNRLSTSVDDATTYLWTVSSTDSNWRITSGSDASTAIYTAGGSGSTATFTLVITRNGCSQSCTYTASSCTVRDNTGGGDPSSSDPCPITPPTEPEPPTVPPVEPEAAICKLNIFPNPFRDKVTFEWDAHADDNATLEIMDHCGNRIALLFQGNIHKGQHYQFEWLAPGCSPFYYYRLTWSKNVESGKLLRM